MFHHIDYTEECSKCGSHERPAVFYRRYDHIKKCVVCGHERIIASVSVSSGSGSYTAEVTKEPIKY